MNDRSKQILELLRAVDAGCPISKAERVRLNACTELNFSFSEFTALPESVGQLANLQSLDLSRTNITALPESVGQLANLQSLDLSRTNITALPESVGRLANLRSLDLRATQITALPESVGRLGNLRSLDLRATQITALPESVGQLANLQSLDLSRTNITALPESVGRLGNLQRLSLMNTKLTALPESVGRLGNLQRLSLMNTKLTALPESVTLLVNLQYLDLEGMPITALPESVGRLGNLENLDLSRTNITALPEALGALPELRDLWLEGLTLDEIPRSLALGGLPFLFREWSAEDLMNGVHGIWCGGLELRKQDLSVFVAGPEAIRALYEGRTTRSRETRLIFLGDGGVGKSYTIRRILNGGRRESEENRYETHETPGVEIEDLRVKLKDGPLELHLWDFGGQEILHSMHRCFLTSDTVYLVMVDSRHKDPNGRARYWLRNLQTFGKGAPVMLMLNCWDRDDGEQLLDDFHLRKDFPNLKSIERINARYEEDGVFRGFMDRLYRFAASSESCGGKKTLPAGWEKARRTVREKARKKNVLLKREFYGICQDCGISDEGRIKALRAWFNILGVSFSFCQSERPEALEEYELLDPAWLTNALYAVIKEGSRQAQEGVIKLTAVQDMLREAPPQFLNGKQYARPRSELRYDETDCGYVLRIAEQFNLAYQINDTDLFFPALCKERQPEETAPAEYTRQVCYEMKYDYLPDSVIHQLMVDCRKRRDLVLSNCWLKGFVLGGFNGLSAVVQMNKDDDKTLEISIYTTGEASAWPLLKTIHEMLETVNQRLSLKCKSYIVKKEPGSDACDRFSWLTLMNMWKSGERWVYGDETRYPLDELLGDIYSPKALQPEADQRKDKLPKNEADI